MKFSIGRHGIAAQCADADHTDAPARYQTPLRRTNRNFTCSARARIQ
jgi:hypothetical protein